MLFIPTDTGDNNPDHSVYITTKDFNKFSGQYLINEYLIKQAKLAINKDLNVAEQK